MVASFRRRHPPATRPSLHPGPGTPPHASSAPSERDTSPPSIPVGALAGAARRLPWPSRRCYVNSASAARAVELPIRPPVRLNFLSANPASAARAVELPIRYPPQNGLPLVCPNCGADMRIVAFITEAAPVRRILDHIGEPAEPPRISPARGPPTWDDPPVDLGPDWDALAQPQPEYVFNQEVQW